MRNHHGTAHAIHEAAIHDHAGTAEATLAELLDLDADVLRRYWTDALTWVRRAARTTRRARILDLGAGTGTGTIALAQRFAGAEVIAVDVSEQMLSRIRAKALDLGLAHRIRTVQADLNDAWPAIEPVDLTWASMSLHHFADPERVLGNIAATTTPGGLLAVAEITEPLRFLPDDLGFGRAGLEARCLDALSAEHAQSLPTLGSDWSARLEAAGFTVLSERRFTIELNPPQPPRTARYARQWLGRVSSGLAHQLAPEDLETLAVLVDGDGPESLQRRADLQVRGSRTVTLARP
jgi:ubiquinone/menaquinone biosynthesis C-methylase UbiE